MRPILLLSAVRSHKALEQCDKLAYAFLYKYMDTMYTSRHFINPNQPNPSNSCYYDRNIHFIPFHAGKFDT